MGKSPTQGYLDKRVTHQRGVRACLISGSMPGCCPHPRGEFLTAKSCCSKADWLQLGSLSGLLFTLVREPWSCKVVGDKHRQGPAKEPRLRGTKHPWGSNLIFTGCFCRPHSLCKHLLAVSVPVTNPSYFGFQHATKA